MVSGGSHLIGCGTALGSVHAVPGAIQIDVENISRTCTALQCCSCSPDGVQRNPGRTKHRIPGFHYVSSGLHIPPHQFESHPAVPRARRTKIAGVFVCWRHLKSCPFLYPHPFSSERGADVAVTPQPPSATNHPRSPPRRTPCRTTATKPLAREPATATTRTDTPAQFPPFATGLSPAPRRCRLP